MGVVDFILNLAALLLWLSWRSLHFDPLAQSTPATLVGTLRRAEPRRWKGWQLLAGLVLLLALRPVLYRGVGSAAGWTPRLDLGVVALAFRSDSFPAGISLRTTALYSVLSFGRLLLVFYFWLLIVGLINRGTAEPDPIQKVVRLHLGRIARWPWPLQLLLPILLTAILWVALHPLLVSMDVLTPTRSPAHLAEQGLLVGVGLFFTLKFLLPVFLLLHLLVSYVYVGTNPLWDFVSTTSHNLLRPIKALRYGKLDLAPVAGVLLTLVLLHWLPNLVLRWLLERNLTLWPQ
ncbi:MAG TPA: hypothetical protein VNZ64_23630 [Candidatus Acidoferrum sp.]|jgi:hypothetical protein|nr:hypothetical protein [Candidatus Acidoferrum sp.]